MRGSPALEVQRGHLVMHWKQQGSPLFLGSSRGSALGAHEVPQHLMLNHVTNPGLQMEDHQGHQIVEKETMQTLKKV